MQTIKKVFTVSLVSAVMSLGASSVLASPHGGCSDGPGKHFMGKGGPGSMTEHFLKRMGGQLDLTDDQKTEIQGIVDKGRKEGQPLRKAMGEAMAAERGAIHARSDTKTLRKMAEKTADARVDLMAHGFQVEKQIEAVLTPEQREKLAAIRAERFAKMQERMEQKRDRWIDE